MELQLIWIIAQRELRDALRNKWLLLYAVGFAALAFALSRVGIASAGYAGLGGFGRTAASLINALLLFVPLLGISIGAVSLASDRERGTLAYLLAQPVNRFEVFIGKAMGAALAVIAALALGFGLAGLALATGRGGNWLAYLALAGYSVLLALVSLGMGFIVSALTRKAATALGAALILWLALVFLSDLGLIGLTLSARPTDATLLGMVLSNPLQIFKLGAVYSLRSTLDTLGAAGQFAVYRFGAYLPVLLIGLLGAWAMASYAVAFALFNRRNDL